MGHGSEGHKYEALVDYLRNAIMSGTLAPGAKIKTEKQLSEDFLTSRQTVRHALGILEKEGLIYRRQGSGSYVRTPGQATEATNTVGIIATYISEYILPSMIRGIEECMAAAGYACTLSSTGNRMDSEKAVLASLMGKPVDGLIVEGAKTALPNPNLSYYRSFIDMGIPIVFLSGYYPALGGCVYVKTDDKAGGRLAAEHLIAKGHRKIGGIFKADDMQGHERFEGFIEAVRENDIELHDSAIHWFTTESRDSLFDAGGAERLLSSFNDCSAVICYNDQIAAPLLNAALRSGRQIPDDLAIISFDNSSYSELTSVKITSLNHPKEEIGRVAARKLLGMIKGRDELPEIIPWTLVEKEST